MEISAATEHTLLRCWGWFFEIKLPCARFNLVKFCLELAHSLVIYSGCESLSTVMDMILTPHSIKTLDILPEELEICNVFSV